MWLVDWQDEEEVEEEEEVGVSEGEQDAEEAAGNAQVAIGFQIAGVVAVCLDVVDGEVLL